MTPLAFTFALPLRSLSMSRTLHFPPRTSRSTLFLTLSPPNDDARVGFHRDTDNPSAHPKRSFFPSAPPSPRAPTPDERVLEQVRQSMRRLGVEEDYLNPPPIPRTYVDISRVNPLSAFAGAVGAAVIAYVAWVGLEVIIRAFLTHPLDGQIYVVRRLGAVVRTGLVCVFALGSGIAGVTGMGLFMLGVRTSVAKVTGEFQEKAD